MTAWVLVAVVAAGCASALWVGPPPRVRARSRRPAPHWVVAVAAVLTAGVLGSPRLVVLATIAGAAALAGLRIWRGRARRLAAAATSTRVLESCEALAAELGAGRPAVAALGRAAEDWPALASVAEAHRVGADVPEAWRAIAAEPGAGDLRVVAAAWQVAHRTGVGLADTLDRVAAGLRETHATRRVVEGELASARATAKLVAVLPVLALTMGSSAGGDPWGFLLGHPVGLGCLALGSAFAAAGLSWIEALAREVDRP